MQISNHHLTYCTNIHTGESWSDTFDEIKSNIPEIKSNVCPNQKMGIGLRLSNKAASELNTDKLNKFITWLQENNLYVFTANAFPFGCFHQSKVKENVHTPDWTTNERVAYTKKMAIILSQLLNIGNEQSISTSPLSYKHWHKTSEETENLKIKSAKNLLKLAFFLHELEQKTGRYIHLAIEPEPDGVIENNKEFITFYIKYLLPLAKKNQFIGEYVVRRHITLCYDICHYAVMYENHEKCIKDLIENNIKIGKIQISSALKIDFIHIQKSEIKTSLSKFVESTYLHQVVQLNIDNTYTHFKDLDVALQLKNEDSKEWRVHFHVPIFDVSFEAISSTQKDILEVLALNQKLRFCTHLEIETYTWDILPGSQKKPLITSIIQEIEWTKKVIIPLKND